MRAKTPAPDATSGRILDVAERLVQTRGFNGFSYADVAAEVGITKASLHYHFATKAELGRRLVVRYTERFAAALERIEAGEPQALPRLREYVRLYAEVLREERMCLCGMIAAEYMTLPAAMQEALRVFFQLNERWLTRLLEQGQADGSLTVRVAPEVAAHMLVGALEGEMLVARAYGDPTRFAACSQLLVAQLASERPRARGSAARPGAHRTRTPRTGPRGPRHAQVR